jgi:NAD(P)-dependent dehydrogenase (short-subunit alcohol dehydrogenase family)
MNAEAKRMFGVRVLVAGAANGIGEAIARTWVRQGARVAALDTASSDVEQRFRNVAGVDSIAMPLDDAAAVVRAAAAHLDGLDVVILSTDLQPMRPINDAVAQDERSRQLFARVKTYCDVALPLLKKSPAGRFVAIGLLRSAFARDAQLLRENTENSLAAHIRKLAAGCGDAGVTINCVQPGAIMTQESRAVFKADKELRDYCIQMSAAGRLGEALDVARAVLFLASDDASFVNGTALHVDGGRAS